MKLELRNFAGTTKSEYRIQLKTVESEGLIDVTLYYEIFNPFSDNEEWWCQSVAVGIGDSYTEALEKALIQAEKKWNIKLLKNQVLKSA